MAANRRTILLASALVLAIVVVAVVWTSGGNTPPAASPPRPAAPRNQSPGDGDLSAAVGRINLDALTSARAQPGNAGRDPFRFKARAPAPSPVSTTPPVPRPPGNQTATTTYVPPPVPTGPPPPPPIPLKFIGIVTQGNKRLAVLTDGKSAPQGGEEGAIILGQYQILKIGNESIEMAYVDGRGRTTIRLTGQ